jgi:hypothetical protein
MLDSRSKGEKLVDEMETVGVLNDGRKIDYALGVVVDKVNGFRRVWHNGSTAGYQTMLARYPDLKLSIAVMCNSSSRTGPLEPDIITEIMGPFATPSQTEAFKPDPETLKKYVGIWKSERTYMPNRITLDNGVLKINGTAMAPQSDGSFLLGPQRFTFKLDNDGKVLYADVNTNGDIRRFTPQSEWTPTADELNAIAGRWYSEEADATFMLVVENGKAFMTQRPATRFELRPQYKDNFIVDRPGAILWFTRDSSGKVTAHAGTSRLRNIVFTKMP